MDKVRRKFEQEIAEGKVVIRRGLSIDAAETFDDYSLDWIYIDTDHSYQTTRKELEIYSKKIRPGHERER